MNAVRILVVEDNEESRQILKDVLEANGFDVETAADGEVGLNKIRFSVKQKEPYAVCITDVMLPKISGIDLLKRSHEISPDTGMIVISAFDEVDPFIRKDAIRSGAYSFLSKPIEPSKLLKCVKEFLSGKKIRKGSGGDDGAVPFFGTVPSRRKTRTYTRYADEPPSEDDVTTDSSAEAGSDEVPPPHPSEDDVTTDSSAEAPPPPPSLDEEHITRPVPDAEHFKDLSDTDEVEEDGEYPYSIAKCPMCSSMIKIARDGVSGKIWCSNCGILFDREDSEIVRQGFSDAEVSESAPLPLPDVGGMETEREDQAFETSSETVDAETAELEAETAGTDEFTRVQESSQQEEIPDSSAAGVSGQGQLKILIVEDDAHALEILETALDVAGYTADTVDTGGQAYSMIIESIKNTDPYDLVICDVMIPEINGLDLMIKVNETRSGIDFILVSAYEDENLSLQKQAEEEGALTFFSKPYDYKELIAFISKYAQSKMK